MPLGFRAKRAFKRIRRTFWRRIPSVKQIVVLGLLISITLLAVSSVGGVGVEPVDEAADQTSNIVDKSLGVLNNTTKNAESSSTAPAKDEPSNADFELAVHREINAVREDQGLQKLEYNEDLASISRNHSQDMAARDYFDHTSPEGWGPSDRVAASDKVQCRVGENLYRESGYSVSDPIIVAERTVEGWMNSPGHRENILRDGWSVEGIGIHVDGREVWVTQMFC